MDATVTTLLAGLGGSLLGGAASVATVYIQANAQRKRELLKMANDVAIKDFELVDEAMRRNGRSYARPPLAVFIHYHTGLAKLIYDGKLDEVSYSRLAEDNEKLFETVRAIDNARKQEAADRVAGMDACT